MSQYDEGCGWIVKPAFTTNGEGVKRGKSMKEVVAILNGLRHKYVDRIPYVMVQPCLKNRMEYKIVCRDGKACYVSSPAQKAGHRSAFSLAPHVGILAFAEHAIQVLKANIPATLSDFLIRVDVMQMNDGTLVVNEFESMEALYTSRPAEAEHFTYQWLEAYWARQLERLLPSY